MKEPRVSIDQAKVLKELLFRVPCSAMYDDAGKMLEPVGASDYNFYRHYFTAPTMSKADRWLRDQHGLHAELSPSISWDKWHVTIHIKSDKGWERSGSYDTYDLALSASVTKRLEIIKSKKEE